eukprot:10849670-Lingulodinium_polyedra.AAC.1
MHAKYGGGARSVELQVCGPKSYAACVWNACARTWHPSYYCRSPTPTPIPFIHSSTPPAIH